MSVFHARLLSTLKTGEFNQKDVVRLNSISRRGTWAWCRGGSEAFPGLNPDFGRSVPTDFGVWCGRVLSPVKQALLGQLLSCAVEGGSFRICPQARDVSTLSGDSVEVESVICM